MVGDAGVGKTSLIHQLTRKKFSQQVMNGAFPFLDLAAHSIDVDTLEIAGYDHFGGGLQRQKPARTRTDHYKTQPLGRSRWSLYDVTTLMNP